MFNPFCCNVGNCIYFCPLWTHISPIWAMKPIICPYPTHMGLFHYRTIGIFITLAHIRPTSVPYGWGDIVPPILDQYLSHMGNKRPQSTHMLPIWEMSAHMRQIITTWVPFYLFDGLWPYMNPFNLILHFFVSRPTQCHPSLCQIWSFQLQSTPTY